MARMQVSIRATKLQGCVGVIHCELKKNNECVQEQRTCLLA